MKKVLLLFFTLSISGINIFAQLENMSGAPASALGSFGKTASNAIPKGAGYPVIDTASLMQAIDQAFQIYDQVQNTITQIENQYEQINNAVEAAKSIDWNQFTNLEGGFDIRKDIKKTGQRVNNVLNKMRNIENTMRQPNISIGGESYSIADLCGVGGIGEPGSKEDPAGMKNFFGKKNLWTAMKDEATYMGEKGKNIAKALTEGLTPEEEKAIYLKYGISATNYAWLMRSTNEVKNECAKAIARSSEDCMQAYLEGNEAKLSVIYKALYSTTDKNGNPTAASLSEANVQLFGVLNDGLTDLNIAINNLAEQNAQQAMREINQEEITKEEESKGRENTQLVTEQGYRQNAMVSDGFIKLE